MTDLGTSEGEGALLDPQEVSDRTFSTAFRGFDPVQVRTFLGVVADELRRLHAREAALRAAIEDGVVAGESGASSEVVADEVVVDVEREASGIVDDAKREADRLVREARERVATLGSAATAEATRVLEEARAEAVKIRATASDDLKGKAEEVEATAVRKIAEAELEAAAIRVRAREEADATIAAALERGREMVSEAQAARERMLADLAKRKRAAQAQLEQLRVGRDRLLDTLRVARRSIDEMTNRFDAGENGSASNLHPPASGTPSGSVSTTPGVASTEARPRPVASAAPLESGPAAAAKARPVRTRAVAIGEAPASAPRPQIAAPQAGGVSSDESPPIPSVAEVAPSAVPTTPVPDRPEPAPREERRSSSLRILRRNKSTEAPAIAPPPVGRESHSEGVRIIGRTPEPAAPIEAEPDPEPPPEIEPDLEREPDRELEPDLEPDAVLEIEDVVDVVEVSPPEPEAEPGPEVEPDVAPDDPEPPPLAKDEIRPRIEDLFARIRADREATTASARQVLGMDADPAGDAAADDVDAPPLDEAPAAEEDQIPVISDVDERILQARDGVLEPLVSQLTKRLKRALQDEQNSSLDRLRTSRGPVKVDQVLSRADDQANPYRHLAGSFLEQAARAGASVSTFGAVAVSVDDLAMQLADDLAGALRSRIDAVLATAASDDLDLSTLSERISSVYREWKVQKVERLAMHYLVSAHERGGFLAFPEETPLRWVVDDDGSCPDCEDNALAGPTPRGRAFPTGQLHPPAHLGCRCLLTTTPT